MAQTFISVDTEADGPIPGPYSMLSLGAVALDENGVELDSFYTTLFPLPGAGQHPKTMEFWDKNPKAFAELLLNREHPVAAMQRFVRWLKQYPDPVFVGYPMGYDWMFTYWYLVRFTYGSPFGHSQALDIKTLMWVGNGQGRVRLVSKRNLARLVPEWFSGRHTHNALDDAREQAGLFVKVRGAVTDTASVAFAMAEVTKAASGPS